MINTQDLKGMENEVRNEPNTASVNKICFPKSKIGELNKNK